ncbi:GNAT family N-acetyltransferase [Sporosarcina sp. ANT_H38]|uniref:GNAT family N-acetyltransferase n=1 Tax=Sporosarcina sp. ANT_H38 TaxID=2597358 RepID=UPI0011F2A77A|nr:GNAT family N-acetyltransferase [Sporosarcina sp. ANT_H38]KAA0965655.1 GNAT family N-acetyltransferase [Sporosarcina sp. ANT_H38]
MEIRLLKPSDAKSYWDLRLEALELNPEAFATNYEEAIKRQNPVESVAKNLSNKGNFTFGAFNNGELLGVVTLLQEIPLNLRHKANILAMYVNPNMRGVGVGKELLSEAINKARTIETIEKLNLTVVTTNEKAKKLYTKLGFKVFGMEEKALKINDKYFNEEYFELMLK